MAAAQQFCLRWNNHQPNFVSVFAHLLKNEALVDVTLGAEGQHVQAHKVVLSACSSYFQQLFAVNPCQHPIVLLKDVKYADLKIVVDFMYCGEVNVTQEQLTSVLRTAEMLQIKGLAEIPEDSLPSVKARLSAEQQGSSVESVSQESVTHQLSWGSTGGAGQGESFGQESRRSPSPVPSPMNRKRLRKNSTGSQSSSTERLETSFEGGPTASPTIIKSESVASVPTYQSEDRGGGGSGGGSREQNNTSVEDRSIEIISSREASIESVDQPGNQMPMVSRVEGLHRDSVASSTSTQSGGSQGCQWMGPRPGFNDPGMGPSNFMHPPFIPPFFGNQHPPPRVASPALGPPRNATSPALNRNIPSPALRSPNASPVHPQQPGPAPMNRLPPPTKKRGQDRELPENFLQALEAVRIGQIGFSKAARVFNVNSRALWLEYKKRGYPSLRKRQQQQSPGSELLGMVEGGEGEVIQVNCDDGQFEEFVNVLENSIPIKDEPIDFPDDDVFDV